jgi:uncharacterized membrane protein
MENFDLMVASLIGAIITLSEVLKALFAKYLPKMEIKGQFVTILAAVLVGVAGYFTASNESGSYIGSLLFAFLASAGVYDYAFKGLFDLFKKKK